MHPFYDRDLSWLSFNQRVMEEAQDEKVPPLERLRFVAIFSSNLDEFFRVRVADIRNFIRVDKKKINEALDFEPKKIFDILQKEVNIQLRQFGETLETVTHILKGKGMVICSNGNYPPELQTQLAHYFRTRVATFLQPVRVKPGDHPFLHNQGLYFALKFQDDQLAILNIPTNKLPRFYQKHYKGQHYYVFLDDLIRDQLPAIFPEQVVTECVAIKLNKDADLAIEDEFSGDLVQKIEKQIQKRDLGKPSRFLYDQSISPKLLTSLKALLRLKSDDLMPGGRYHNMYDLFQIKNPGIQDIEYPELQPIWHHELGQPEALFEAIAHKGRLFHFPYHSYDYILQFFNEASLDPEVQEINVTFYRMAENSMIGEALISAAKNGKRVFVFMEVKARFDEANNLLWARRMEDVGIRIIYSLPGLKVHAKAALIKKENVQYAFLGTGNLNEKTARLYSDFGLLTADHNLCQELSALFKYLYAKKQPDGFNHLIVSQFNSMSGFLQLIQREIDQVKAGKKGAFTIKVNNLQEKQLIEKIYEAAEAGVEVKLLIRSICCLVPGTHGIKVKRVVDRYLEHARVFHFYHMGEDKVYLGSSDWMNRNLHRRIEVTFPIQEPNLKKQILDILSFHWEDNQKACWLNENLENIPAHDTGRKVRAQMATYDYLNRQ